MTLIVDVFGRPDNGGWYAATRLVSAPAPTSGALAFATLRFVDAGLRTLGGQALDGAIRGLRRVSEGATPPASSRHPLIARYAASLDSTPQPAVITPVVVRWQPELSLKQAVITAAGSAAEQSAEQIRAQLLAELHEGIERWTRDRLQPRGMVWDWSDLWKRWVDDMPPPWHK